MKTRYIKSHLIRWLFSIIVLKPKGTKQLLKELKFAIGEQYENYEFDLKDYGSRTINELTYEIYLYDKGDFKTLFRLPVESILLYFNADILSCVEYKFEEKYIKILANKLNKNEKAIHKSKIQLNIKNYSLFYSKF